VDEVLQDAERRVGHGQREARPLGVVDQPVAQAEVEQRVLPLLHARRRLGPAAGCRGDVLDRMCGCTVCGPVLDDLQDAVLVAGAGRQREDAVLAGAVHVGDAEDPVELAGQPGGVGGAVQVGAGLAHGREQPGLDQADEPEVDQVHQGGGVGGGGALGAALLAPVTEEGVSSPHPSG
jgi:hypothetical protein